MKLFVIYGSSRKNGNSEVLTKRALEHLKTDQYRQVTLLDYHIEPIIDERHTASGFQPVDDDYEILIEELMNYDAILFATPLYWYGMSGRLKNFIDRFTQSMRSEKYDFKEFMKGKKMFVVIAGGPSSPVTALPLLQQFQLISQFFSMDFSGYMIGKGVKPLEVLEDEESVTAAVQFGKKIKAELDKPL